MFLFLGADRWICWATRAGLFQAVARPGLPCVPHVRRGPAELWAAPGAGGARGDGGAAALRAFFRIFDGWMAGWMDGGREGGKERERMTRERERENEER